MNKFITVLSIALFSMTASAFDMGLGVGYRTNDASAVSGADPDGEGTLQFGGILWADINEQLVFRSGFMYSQLKYEGVGSEVELTYVMIPVTLMLKLEDYGGVFGGVNLGLKASDDCSPVDCTEVKSTVVPLTIGGYFKVAPQVAVEVFYEMLSGEFVSGLEDNTSVGANLLFTFD